MNIREMNKHPEQNLHTIPLYLDEVELISLPGIERRKETEYLPCNSKFYKSTNNEE